ncbi:hypothetical protein [Nitrospira sp. Kam-Ns4a]
MIGEADQPSSLPRVYKLQGTLVSLDLVHKLVAIQPSGHRRKRTRQFSLTADTEILAGGERLTISDLVIGDWVHVQFIKQGGGAILRTLHLPRPGGLAPPADRGSHGPSGRRPAPDHHGGLP